MFERPLENFEHSKSIKELVQQGFIENLGEGRVAVYMDNRTFNVSGLTGQHQNFNFGDDGKIEQSITYGSEVDINKLFTDLRILVEGSGDSRDKEMVEALESNVKEKKMDNAKTIFGLLAKTIQVSAAGIAISKAFGWM